MSYFVDLPNDTKDKSCVLVFSGGQDSTTCLGIALANFSHVYCVTFTYGQRHEVEVYCAKAILDQYNNCSLDVLTVPTLQQLADSALIRGAEQKDVSAQHSAKPELPASYVPNRNATFLTLAHAFAQKVGAEFVMTGVCETDYSGYPDCREEFIQALQVALNKGSNSNIQFLTPLMHHTKADTFHIAEEYGFLDMVLNFSHTCYNGKRGGKYHHEWGHGCGECPACKLRAKGWEEFLNGSDSN